MVKNWNRQFSHTRHEIMFRMIGVTTLNNYNVVIINHLGLKHNKCLVQTLEILNYIQNIEVTRFSIANTL